MYRFGRRGVLPSVGRTVGAHVAALSATRTFMSDSAVAADEAASVASANPPASPAQEGASAPKDVVPPTATPGASRVNSNKNRLQQNPEAVRRQKLLISKLGPAAFFVTPRLAAAAFSDYRAFAGQEPQVIREMLCDYLNLYHKSKSRLGTGSSKHRKAVRDCGKLLSQVQLDALFQAFFVAVENQSLPIVSAARVFRFRWPPEAVRYKRYARSVIVSRVTQAIIKSQQQQPKAEGAATATTPGGSEQQPKAEGAATATTPGGSEQQPASDATPPTPTAATAPLSRRDATSLLLSMTHAVRNNPPIIGSLANIALSETADASFKLTPKVLVQIMWAVHESKTPAPASFWHNAIATLRAKQLSGNSDKDKKKKTTATAVKKSVKKDEADEVAVEAGEFISPLAPKKPAQAEDIKISKSSEGRSALQKATEESKKKKAAASSTAAAAARWKASAVSPSTTFRALRVLHLEGIGTDTSFQRLLAESALAFIGDAVADMQLSKNATTQPMSVSLQTVASRIHIATDGLSPKGFLSLLQLAGALGIRFSSFGHRFARELLYPLVRHVKEPSGRDLFLGALSATECHDPEMVQVFIDAIVLEGSGRSKSQNNNSKDITSASKSASSVSQQPLRLQSVQSLRHLITLSDRLCKVIAKHNGLAARLQLGPFAEMLFRVISCEDNSLLLRPPEMLRFVEQLYIVSRHYDSSSTFACMLRDVVEKFADVYANHLEAGVLPLVLANRLLEFTIMLKMRPGSPAKEKQNASASSFPNVLRLLALRNKAHAILEARGDDSQLDSFTGPWAVVRVYSEMVIALQALTFDGPRALAGNPQQLDIPRLQQTLRKFGIVPALAATVLLRDLYFQRSTRRAAVIMNGLFQKIVCQALLQHIREAKFTEDVEPTRQQLLNALGMWPLVAKTPRSAAVVVSDAGGTEVAVATSKERMESLWALLKASPVVQLKRHKELWILVRHVAKALKADPSDMKKADELAALASASTATKATTAVAEGEEKK